MATDTTPPTAPAEFEAPAAADRLERLAETLRLHNIEAVIVDDGAQARDAVLAMVPPGAEVHWGKSATLDAIGVTEALLAEGRYDPVRPKYMAMDRATQGREIRKVMSAPDYMLASAQAVTDDGELVIASYSGSQIGPIAAGAGRVILVVGSQKIVADLGEGVRRAREHVLPYESARLQEQLGVPSRLARLLVVYEEPRPGRLTVVLVREPVGV